jgi:DNA-binding PadR family transcriptional regulator
VKTRLPSDKELVILRLLRDGSPERYGLELVNASDGALGRASIYVTLARMETKGFLRSRTPPKDDHPGLPRPRYKITALGEKVLRAAEAAQVVLGAGLARVGA